jgi:UDP-N-acetylglucosamine acyltransferase
LGGIEINIAHFSGIATDAFNNMMSSTLGTGDKENTAKLLAVIDNVGGDYAKLGNIGNFLGIDSINDDADNASNVFGYGTKIAGDCIIGDRVIFSSGVIANPGSRVGDAAMIQSGTRFSKDIPPFIVATDNPVRFGGVNKTILRNYSVDEKEIAHIANAYRLVFHGQTSLFDAIQQIKDQVPDSEMIQNVIRFLSGTKLGVIGTY